MKLSKKMRETLSLLPDASYQWAFEFHRSTLAALEKRGLAKIEHVDGLGEPQFHGWRRTKAGRAAIREDG